MLNPFGFSPDKTGDFAQAKLREASRSLNRTVLLAMNEILRFHRSLRMTLARDLSFQVSRAAAIEKSLG
jgi:hypothetical protein